MDYQEFYTKLIDLDVNIEPEFDQETGWEYQSNHSHPKEKVTKPGRDAIVLRHEVGGSHYGNCWGGKSKAYFISEPIPEFQDLNKILEELVPNITYLQYKKLDKNIVHEKDESEREYYGNRTDYKVIYIFIEELFEYLKSLGVL